MVQFFCPVKILNLWFKILLKLVVIMTCFREDRSEHQIPFGWKSGWRFWGSVTDFVKNWGTTLEQKPSELWTYSKAHLIYESALMKLPELWLNLMKSGVVSLWLWLIWHSNHSSSLSCFPRSLVYNVNLVRKAALEYSRCDYILQCFVANRVTKHFRNNNLHGNFLSDLCEVVCRIHSHFHGFSGCLPLVRFGIKTCQDLLWNKAEIYLSSPSLFLSCPAQGSCLGSYIDGNTHRQRLVRLTNYRHPSQTESQVIPQSSSYQLREHIK